MAVGPQRAGLGLCGRRGPVFGLRVDLWVGGGRGWGGYTEHFSHCRWKCGTWFWLHATYLVFPESAVLEVAADKLGKDGG